MLSVDEKIEHLKKLDNDFCNNNLSEVENLYSGKDYDKENPMIKRLVELSKNYCMRFTELSYLISLEKDEEKIHKYQEEKNGILDILFPGHGPIFGGGDGLFAIIGMADLEGYNYINARVHFNPSALVHLKRYVFVASNVDFGDFELSGKVSTIEVKPDTWIGANVHVGNNVVVGEKSVIGMGSNIVEGTELQPSMISFGSPCKEYKLIEENYETAVKRPAEAGIRSDDEIREIIEHVRSLGIDGDFSEYIKALKCEKYDTLEPTIAKIYELSHKLCSEYNSGMISIRRRKEILNALIPLHGDNLEVGDDVFIDCIGTVKIGNNVKIGNHATLAGNITIGDNVKIGDNVAIQTTGHEIYYEGRRLRKKEDGNLCEISTPGYIIINPEIELAKGTMVKPDTVVSRNTEENELYTGR